MGDRAIYLVGVFLLAASITAVWLGMRAVMDIGGSCASGGPYEVAVECPAGVDLAMLLAFPFGFLGVGIIVWKGARLGAGWVGVAALAWPALFLSLGWNFLEYAFRSPGGLELGWLIPGVIFVIMGGVPLLAWIGARGDTHIVPGVAGTRARSDVRQLRDLRDAMAVAARNARTTAGSRAATMTVAEATHPGATAAVDAPAVAPARGRPADTLVDELERLARLRAAGSLTLEEFTDAKAALIAAAAASAQGTGT